MLDHIFYELTLQEGQLKCSEAHNLRRVSCMTPHLRSFFVRYIVWL
jgi:hypothetical protein